MSDEVLQHALRVLSLTLDRLVGACMNERGEPQAPPRQILMRARAALPPYCPNAFPTTKEKT
jgi:hypothetical protein